MLWISANQLVSGVCLFVSFLDKATICQSDLLTAFDDATAKVPTGFWIDHGGNMLLGLQVKEEFLAALRLLPECKTAAVSDWGSSTPQRENAHTQNTW